LLIWFVMNLADLFEEVANRMRADLEAARKAFTHSGLKGGEFEEIFRRFLRDYLPKSLEISTGQVIDSLGGVSRQLDVIISDAAKTPIFYRSAHNRVIPIECVYAAIEVKAHLDTAELEKTMENMRSVKTLVKRAYGPEMASIKKWVPLYGQNWDIWPVNYFIFAYDSVDLTTIYRKLVEIHERLRLPPHERVDSVCVLDKGVICNTHLSGPMIGKYDALPDPNTHLCVVESKRALLYFYALWSPYFNSAWLPLFNFHQYLGQITF
jgi:hypothetical protein